MGVAAIELIPRSQERVEPWMLAGALLVGAIAAAGLATWSRRVRSFVSPEAGRSTTWGAYAAVGVDLLSDGMMIGSGGAVAAELGVLLALSQVVGNLPGGFAIAANFQGAGIPKAKRWAALALYPLIPLAAGAVSFFAIQDAGELTTGLVLGAFGGLLLTATIEDMIPEADQPGAPRHVSTPAFAAGFAALLLMSAYL
jgi:zinc transporter, ZIP family